MAAVAQQYLDWCQAQGIQLLGVTAGAVADGGRGVVATEGLEPGTVFLKVPARLLISRCSAEADPALGPLLSAPVARGLDSYQVLGVHLLHEVSKCKQQEVSSQAVASAHGGDVDNSQQASSRWAPYLRELPRSYTTLSYFTPAAVEQLQVLSAKQAAQEAAQKVQAQWREARPLMDTLDVPAKYRTLAAWRWAMATLMSRTMYVPWDTAGALTPFGDLLNHQSPPGPATPEVLPTAPSPATSSSPAAADSTGAMPAASAADWSVARCLQGNGKHSQAAAQPEVLIPPQLKPQAAVQEEMGKPPPEKLQTEHLRLHQQHAQRQCQCQQQGASQCPGDESLCQGNSASVDSLPDAGQVSIQTLDGVVKMTQTQDSAGSSLGGHSGMPCSSCNSMVRSAIHQPQACQDVGDTDVGCPAVQRLTGPVQQERLLTHQVGLAAQQEAAAAADAAASEQQGPTTETKLHKSPATAEQHMPAAATGEHEATVTGSGASSLWGEGSYNADTDMYELRALRRYESGEQVYVSYGQHNNLELLELYGFVLPLEQNPHEAVQIPIPLLNAVCRSCVSCPAGVMGAGTAKQTNTPSLSGLSVRYYSNHGVDGATSGAGHTLVGQWPKGTAGTGLLRPQLNGTAMAGRPTAHTGRVGVGGKHTPAPTWETLVAIARAELLGPDATTGEAAAVLRGAYQHDGKQVLPDSLTAKECFVHADGAPSWQLLQALRWTAATPAERKRHAATLAAGGCVSTAGDMQAMRWLCTACAAVLHALPTTAEQDEHMLSQLSQNSGSHSEQNCCSVLTSSMAACSPSSTPVVPTAAAACTNRAEAEHVAAPGIRQSGHVQAPAACTTFSDSEHESWQLAFMWRLNYKRLLCKAGSLAMEYATMLQLSSS